MLRRIPPVCLLIALVPTFASAQAGRVPTAEEAANKAALARRPLHAELLRPTEFQYLDTQLGDVVNDLELRHKIEIFLDQTALAAEGKSSETPFTKTIKGIPFGRALGHLLDDEGLIWFERDDMLYITTPKAAREVEQTTVYSVAALADEGSEPDYEAIADVVDTAVFRAKLMHVNRTVRPYRPTKSLVVATNPLEHLEIAKLIGELAEAKKYKGDERSLPEPTETDAAITRVLATPTEVQYLDTPLDDVRTDLELRMRVFIEFDEPAIAEAATQRGKRGTVPLVSYSVRDVPVGVVLDQMLEPLGLTWTRDDVAIVITSKAAESNYSMRRMYRVADLAAGVDASKELAELVRETVATDTWVGEQSGGFGTEPLKKPVGQIASFAPAGVIVVTQTPRAHRAIEKLLDDLREAKKAK
jgi:hypothetical protein